MFSAFVLCAVAPIFATIATLMPTPGAEVVLETGKTEALVAPDAPSVTVFAAEEMTNDLPESRGFYCRAGALQGVKLKPLTSYRWGGPVDGDCWKW